MKQPLVKKVSTWKPRGHRINYKAINIYPVTKHLRLSARPYMPIRHVPAYTMQYTIRRRCLRHAPTHTRAYSMHHTPYTIYHAPMGMQTWFPCTIPIRHVNLATMHHTPLGIPTWPPCTIHHRGASMSNEACTIPSTMNIRQVPDQGDDSCR